MDDEPVQTGGIRPLSAALVLAVIVGLGGWLLVGHGGGRSTLVALSSPSPPAGYPIEHTLTPEALAPTAAPTPFTPSTALPPPAPVRSTVPAGVRVVYYWSAGDVAPGSSSGGKNGPGPTGSTVLHAVDLSGHEVGRITVPGDGAGMLQSPNGEEIYVPPEVYGADGHLIGAVPADTFSQSVMWADDSRHLCDVLTLPSSAQGPPAHLVVYTPNLPPRIVAALPSSLNWGLLACSTTSDRAVLHGFDGSAGGPILDRVLVVRLSDGHEIMQHDYCNSASACAGGAAPSLDGASPDGTLLMERTADGVVVLNDLRTGKLTSTGIHGGGSQLSSDGTVILITLAGTTGISGPPATVPGLVLVDWRAGRTVWRAPNAGTINGFTLALPGSGVIAVAAGDYHPNTGVFPSGPVTLYLIAPSGRAVIVARDIERIPVF